MRQARFSPAEYKQLYEAKREYARKPFHGHYKWNAEQVHDYVLFLANTGLRPDEAKNIQHRDVTIVVDNARGRAPSSHPSRPSPGRAERRRRGPFASPPWYKGLRTAITVTASRQTTPGPHPRHGHCPDDSSPPRLKAMLTAGQHVGNGQNT